MAIVICSCIVQLSLITILYLAILIFYIDYCKLCGYTLWPTMTYLCACAWIWLELQHNCYIYDVTYICCLFFSHLHRCESLTNDCCNKYLKASCRMEKFSIWILASYYICDRACETRPYLHTKFSLFWILTYNIFWSMNAMTIKSSCLIHKSIKSK